MTAIVRAARIEEAPIVLDILKLAHANRHTQTAAFRGFSAGVCGAELFGVCQRGVDQLLKIGAAVAEAGVSGGRSGRRVWFFHIGRYDTWLCHVN